MDRVVYTVHWPADPLPDGSNVERVGHASPWQLQAPAGPTPGAETGTVVGYDADAGTLFIAPEIPAGEV